MTGCEYKQISELSAEDGIVRLRELSQDESWERLIQEINEYRSRFPYSQYAAEADLLQGNAYFRTARHPEAIASYDDFLRRNPSHKDADLALFRIAKSYDAQCPEEPEREQATTQKAIEKYTELKARFPKSEYSAEGIERSALLRQRLAAHHLFIGNFYWKKSLYHSALNRYLIILNRFSDLREARLVALERAAEGYLKLAEQLESNPNSDTVSYFRSQTPSQLRDKSAELNQKKQELLSTSPETKAMKSEG
jgi:outer membrane protein assembly factor BamD